MKTVLGLSVTSNSVGWVLLDGPGVDANALDHDVFDVATKPGEHVDISSHVTAVRGALSIAAASGHELTSVGLTWTPDAAATASLLLTSLPDLGFEKIASVRLSEAARTWACAYAGALGFEKAAVCVVEPSAATLLSFGYGAVRTFTTHNRDSEDGLSRWLKDAFETNHLGPERLFLIGSRGDVELMSGRLDEALPMSVVTSNEAQLVLARGAALAVRSNDATVAIPLAQQNIDVTKPTPGQKLSWFSSPARAAVVFVAGLLFVPVPVLVNQPDATTVENQPAANSSTASESIQAVPVPAAPQPAMSVMKRMAQPAPAPLPPSAASPPIARLPVTAEPLAVPETPAAPEAPVTGVPEAVASEVPQGTVTDVPQASVAGEQAEVAHLPVPAEVPHLQEQTQHLPDQGTLHLPGAPPVLAAEAPIAETTPPPPPPAPVSSFFAALP